MASLTITAVKHNGGAQANTQPGSSQILMNENVASGTIVGKVTGFAGNPATMNLVVEPANLYANRYELWNGTFTDDDGVTQSGWFIRVKSGGTTLMDYEDQNFGYNPDFPELGGAIHSQITFKFYTGPVSSTNLTDQLVFDTILKDIVNEGPDNTPPHTIELDNGLTDTVVENLGVGQAVGTLTAQDDSTPAASISYSFATGFNGAGHFEIVGNQVKVKTALNYEDAVTTTPGAGLEQDAIGKFYRLKVIATDNATPALSSAEQEIKVYVTDFNEAPGTPSYTGTPSVVENASSTTVGTIVTVGGSTDPEGLAVTYHLSSTAGANPGNRFVVGTDGKISLATGVTLDYEATDLQTDATGKYYTVQVVAKDPALNTSAVKDVKIYVTDVNETPANTPPHTIQLDGGTTDGVAESLGVGQAVGTLTAQDDSTPAAGITYSFVAGFNGNGHFTIDNTTKQIKVATALNFEDAVTTTPGAGLEQDAIGKFYRLKVIATDNATPALSSAEQEIKVYVTDFNEAPGTPSYTGTPSVVENASSTTVGTIVTVGGSTDPEGLAVTYHLSSTAGANPGNRFVVGTDGKISLATGVTLDYEATDLQTDATGKYYTVQVVAKDPALNTSAVKDVKIYVTDVNETPANVAPSIAVDQGGTVAYTAANQGPVRAFKDLTVSDTDTNDQNTMVIKFTSLHGSLTAVAGSGITVPAAGSSGTDKVYTFTGTAAELTAILENLQFDPDDRAAGGAVQTTTFTIEVTDPTHGHTTPSTVNNVTVASTPPAAGTNAAPSIAVDQGGTVAYTAANQGPVRAFKDLTVSDTDTNDQNTMVIKFTSLHGSLTAVAGSGITVPAAGSSGTDKVYTFTGTAAELTAILENLQFDPDDRAAGGAVQTTTFTIEVTDPTHGHTTPSTVNNVTVASTPPVIPPNNAPTGLSLSNVSVLEYDLVGKEIGTFSATDLNNDVLTYTLLDNAGGRFAISGNKLVLAGTGVNYEEAKSHQIKVRVDDNHGGVIDQVFTINVGDQTTLNKRGTKKADKMNGSTLDDILKGGTGTVKDIIKGLAGDDQLYGENGNDSLLGGDGLDTLSGGKGNDTLKGEAGKDLLKGEVGDDKMYGGFGNDALFGGKGNDVLKGDADDDVLYGEEGNDTLTGGAGNDTFVFSKKTNKSTNFDRITDFKSGQDKLFLDNAVFKKLGTTGTFDAPAKLDITMFKTGKAKDKNDYLVYKGGVLYYDTNGSAKGGEVEIVKLKGLKVTDIWVI